MEQERREELPGASGAPSPAPVPGEMERLNAALEEASRERDQFRSLAQRIQADFINYRRRVEEEREELQKGANARLILDLLGVTDDFRRALDGARGQEQPREDRAAWVEGVELIYRKLLRVLEREGVTAIEALGKSFDPWEHEALLYQDSPGHREGEVIHVVQEGYKLHGKVLRPAQVVVAKVTRGPEGSPSSSQEGSRSPLEEE